MVFQLSGSISQSKKNPTLKSSIDLDSVMYEFQILPFWNNLKNFTRSLRPSDSLPPVSPPFWRHIAKSDFFIFANCISRDHISDLWTGIFSLGSLIVCFPSLQLGPPPVCNFGFVTFRHLDLQPEAFSHFLLRISYNICDFTTCSNSEKAVWAGEGDDRQPLHNV